MSEAPKPPYVQFEVRPVEDREASLEAGKVVYRDEVFAIVTPAGTRDRLEKIASEWIANLWEGAKQERIPSVWPEAYEQKLKSFLQNKETPIDGTPLESMTTLTPAQVKNCLNANVRTVEDLAQANEEAMIRIGMGGRDLKQKAQAWLDTIDKKGKPAEELNRLRTENDAQKTQLAELTKKLEDATARLEVLEKVQEKA